MLKASKLTNDDQWSITFSILNFKTPSKYEGKYLSNVEETQWSAKFTINNA